jgi:hypothetical protein
MSYREQVLRYRVMRQLNDQERNPNGDWSLVYSSMDHNNAIEEMQHQVDVWAKCGDAFKVVDAGQVTYIDREMW